MCWTSRKSCGWMQAISMSGAWPDLGTADDEQYEWLTEAYKIKRKNNEKIVILASDGTKLEGHYYERKKNAPLVIFFHGFRSHSYVDATG